jgi:hypothetical protein
MMMIEARGLAGVITFVIQPVGERFVNVSGRISGADLWMNCGRHVDERNNSGDDRESSWITL